MLNEVLFNIYSNFIHNKLKTVRPHQAPWIMQAVKNFLRKKDCEYKFFVRRDRLDDKLDHIQKIIFEGPRLTEEAKRNYFFKARKTLANSMTSSKTYWSLINAVLNKAKIPLIPPFLENGLFVTDFAERYRSLMIILYISARPLTQTVNFHKIFQSLRIQ